MKNNYFAKAIKLPLILRIGSITAIFMLFATNSNLQGKNLMVSDDKHDSCFNNSAPPDTIPGAEQIGGQTYYLDGLDTVFIIEDVAGDSMARMITIEDIGIKLTNYAVTPPYGIDGFNLQDFYLMSHANPQNDVNYTAGNLPSDYLTSLAPKTLRYPGGSSCKYKHAFGSMNSTDPGNPFAGQKNGGYGINIEELIPLYDQSGPGGALALSTLVTDYLANNNELPNGSMTWMDVSLRDSFKDYFNEWYTQEHFDPAMYTVLGVEEIWNEPLAINYFIDQIEQLETENPGLEIHVMLTLNILTETAQDYVEIINYLIDPSMNHEYDVKFVGVEMGNENYNNFFGTMMGWDDYVTGTSCYTAFDHFWAYINGADDYNAWFGITGDFNLATHLPASMMGLGADGINKHNYLYEIKHNFSNRVPIGIPAEKPTIATGPFIVDPESDHMPDTYLGVTCPTWNEDLYSHYGDLVDTYPAFDAVIIHPYYNAKNDNDPALNTNWGEIPIGSDVSPCLDGDPVASGHQDFPTTGTLSGLYTYGTPDSRLDCAFNGIIGNVATPPQGNFRQFVVSRYKIGIEDVSTELHFEPSEPNPKYCWATEWNLNNNSSYDAADVDGDAKTTRRYVYHQKFVHSYLMQEEMLDFIKINYKPEFREGFMQYTCIQGFLGGTNSMLLRGATPQDKVELGIGLCTDDDFKDFVPRTTYYSLRLMNQIHLQNLGYLQSTYTVHASNINKAPTTFLSEQYIVDGTSYCDAYVYYTNLKDEDQVYVIKPGTLAVSLTGNHAEIHCIQASQLYSASGKSELFDINDSYNTCNTAGYANQYEMRGELPPYTDMDVCPLDMPPGSMCVTVPAHSCGYFVFSFEVLMRLGEVDNIFALYPNPSSSMFQVTQTNLEVELVDHFNIKITNANGQLEKEIYDVGQNESIDISDLPVGIYFVSILIDGIKPETKMLSVVR